jgi:cytochrome c556
MRILSVLSLAAALGASVACGSTTPAEPAAEGEFRPTSTIKEIMDSVVDPSADVLWESVATTIDRTGQTDKMPRTDEDWVTVRRSAVALVEATNLLMIRPRRVAPAGEKSQYPGIELEPEQIQAAVDADRTAWVKHAHDLHDAAMVALKAIDAKNVKGLMDAGEGIDEACEKCHTQYWYPDKKPS